MICFIRGRFYASNYCVLDICVMIERKRENNKIIIMRGREREREREWEWERGRERVCVLKIKKK